MTGDQDGVASLEGCLADAFSRHELDAFVRSLEGGARLARELPGPLASPMQVSVALVAALLRHGVLDHEFFRRLRDARPARTYELSLLESACLSSPEQERPLRPGGMLCGDRYRLDEIVEVGGYGTLWRAYDRQERRPVAIKVFSRDMKASDYALRRNVFIRGANRMAAIRDPYVAQVYVPHVSEGGHDFCVLEYVPGASLSNLVKRRSIEVLDLVHTLLDIGAGLAAIHRAGLIHGDVSPKNILIDEQRCARLVDFDLVSDLEDDLFTRVATERPSTDPFSAPEWKTGGKDIDCRVDIFGFGMTIVYALYGKALPKSLNDLDADLDTVDWIDRKLVCASALKAALKKACSLDRNERHADMTSFCVVLEQAVSSARHAGASPAEETPPPTFEQAAPPQPPATGDDLVGELLADRYRVLERIHEGEAGVVYRVEHQALQRRLAMKVLRAQLSLLQSHVVRFLCEAQAASMITHPNVVEVLDFGMTLTGQPFFVMEYLAGKDLSEFVAEGGPLPWKRARGIMLQICSALQAAHERGVVHRDVNPRNVILIQHGTNPDDVKVLGFGIAKILDPEADSRGLTQSGAVVGTPEYMSPEQGWGQPVDHRTDVYATGVLLYELLTARIPFPGATMMEVLNRHIFEVPNIIHPNIPEAVGAIILKAMQKDRALRFQSMGEMATAIEAVGTGASQVAVVDEEIKTPWSSITTPIASLPGAARPRRRVWFSVLSVVSAVSVLGYAWIPAPPSPEPTPAPPLVHTAPQPQPAPEELSKVVLPPEPPRVRFTIATPGVNAQILDARDEGQYGLTNDPAGVEVRKSHETLMLILRATGFDDLHFDIIPDEDKRFEKQLVPSALNPTSRKSRESKGQASNTGTAALPSRETERDYEEIKNPFERPSSRKEP